MPACQWFSARSAFAALSPRPVARTTRLSRSLAATLRSHVHRRHASPAAGSLLRALELVGRRVHRAATLHTGHLALGDAEEQTNDEAVSRLNSRAAQTKRDPEKLVKWPFDAVARSLQPRLSEHPLLLVGRSFAVPGEDSDKAYSCFRVTSIVN
ncbi:hypothetical protein PF002_g21860 [Phytophthora fragariae]|uniref:Uncharacterized protein n=1 Tax=Phytophthora fragariae TaxID=53985 RepID=A0A6A3XJF6_9STRA|nr:hypothetical protein PF002_g21860 [Phytophthora fragariae]